MFSSRGKAPVLTHRRPAVSLWEDLGGTGKREVDPVARSGRKGGEEKKRRVVGVSGG